MAIIIVIAVAIGYIVPVFELLRLYVHIPIDPLCSKNLADLCGNFLLILNFQKTYNSSYGHSFTVNICELVSQVTALLSMPMDSVL